MNGRAWATVCAGALFSLEVFASDVERLESRVPVLEEDYARARAASLSRHRARLELEVQTMDWMRQVNTSEAVKDQQREKVKRAKRLFDYYSRRDAVASGVVPAEQMRKLFPIKVDGALKRMKQLAAIGRRLDTASSRAWSCWTTATSSGKKAELQAYEEITKYSGGGRGGGGGGRATGPSGAAE